MLFNTLNQAVELGWDFYLPVIIFVILAALAVPVWRPSLKSPQTCRKQERLLTQIRPWQIA